VRKRNYPRGRAPAVRVPWDRVAELARQGLHAAQIIDALHLGGTGGTLRLRAAKRGIAIRLRTSAERSADAEAREAIWTDARVAELRERFARREPVEAIARALGTSSPTVHAKIQRLGLRRATFMPPASATPEGANAPRRLPACLPVPKVPGPILPAIAALLEAA
jgi:hypothetical protein